MRPLVQQNTDPTTRHTEDFPRKDTKQKLNKKRLFHEERNAKSDVPNLLCLLTDDMWVLEAPSFIVPHLYERPPPTSEPGRHATPGGSADAYFDSPLGKFFVELGLGLVLNAGRMEGGSGRRCEHCDFRSDSALVLHSHAQERHAQGAAPRRPPQPDPEWEPPAKVFLQTPAIKKAAKRKKTAAPLRAAGDGQTHRGIRTLSVPLGVGDNAGTRTPSAPLGVEDGGRKRKKKAAAPRPDTPHPAVSEEYVECELCSGYLRDSSHLRTHLRVKHGELVRALPAAAPLPCPRCAARCHTARGLARHLLTHGLLEEGLRQAALAGTDRGRCPVCLQMCPSGMVLHMQMEHKRALKFAAVCYKCPACAAIFPHFPDYEDHVAAVHLD